MGLKFSIKGFTLIELLVVVAIIGALVAIILPQLNKYNRYATLETAATQLQGAFRNAQNNASSGITCATGNHATSWYLRFIDEVNYKIGANCSNPAITPTPTPISFKLPAGIKVESIEISQSLPCREDNKNYFIDMGVDFKNISGKASILGSKNGYGCQPSINPTMIKIRLISIDTESKKVVVVTTGGSIYVSSN